MLDWEENLFVGLKALYHRAVVRPKERRAQTVRATLREHRAWLLILAEMIARRHLAIFETTDSVLGHDDRIFLPPAFTIALSIEGNEALYEVRAILAALALRDGWNRHSPPLSEVHKLYADELPHLAGKLERLAADLPAGTDLWTTLGALPIDAKPATGRTGALPSEPETGDSKVTTELEGKGQSAVEVLPARGDDGDGADLPMHTFEKVETLEEYSGQSRKSDADDELEEHGEALRELTMTQVLRSAERPRSIYRSDLILDGLALQVGDDGPGTGVPYPEWDYRRHAYRPDWCLVREKTVAEPRGDWVTPVETRHRRLIHRLRCQFAALTSEWLRVRRQTAGVEFDIDALVDSEVERRTGHTPTEAIYQDRRRDLHDIAALILIDESYSTDAWLGGVRVLDVIRESVFCAAQVLDDSIAHLALATFTSNTRRSCEFNTIKSFNEAWPLARNRLGSLEAHGYTRIGPALRHAQERLAGEKAARKVVILLTDGRPCDYDRYEGIYGIKDVKKAIDVGLQNGIQTHAFAVEKQAAEYFPRMFTQHHYDILPTPERLTTTMCRLFARLLAA